jgi:hypothetical protein
VFIEEIWGVLRQKWQIISPNLVPLWYNNLVSAMLELGRIVL